MDLFQKRRRPDPTSDAECLELKPNKSAQQGWQTVAVSAGKDVEL